MVTFWNFADAVLDTSRTVKERQKRAFLVYQPGLNWVQMVMGIGLPIEVQDNSITMGAVVKSYYELPNNVTQYTNPTIDIERKKRRRRATPSRWDIYNTLQDFIKSFGFSDGKSCLLNSVCESSKHNFDPNAGVLAELLHLLLTPSTTSEDVENALDRDFYVAEMTGKRTTNIDCQRLYPCESNLVQKFTRLFS
ncbi:uncharacterized protein [Atheta coriaria]|uniref:uncharacterized protein n=1 Tax=Dalotia coriaria TaxID=877792 RepID=UPI0031F4519E